MASAYSDTSLDPLPEDIRNGMIAMALFGLASTLSTFTLMSFITYRMVFWRRYYDQPIHTNQVFVLIYNLLLADFQQALSFLISFHWLAQGKLVGPNTHCFAQGWLIQIGDLSSGLWVLSIAVHTLISLVGQKKIRQRFFVAYLVSLWSFCLFLSAIGPLLSKDDFFVPAGTWCWISETHEKERLYLHYLWIFISQLGSLVIYISLFFFLRGRLTNNLLSNPSLPSNSNNEPSSSSKFKHSGLTTTTIISPSNNTFVFCRQRIIRTARYMVVYPFAYMALTLPLAAARVSSMTGKTPALVFFPVAGSLIASCGAIDVILYIWTRKALLRSSVGTNGSNYPENVSTLRRFEPGEERQRTQSIIMNGLGKMNSDSISTGNGASVGNQGKGGFGEIVVSRTVVMSEDSNTTPRQENSRRGERSDSLKSLVGKKDEDLVPPDFEAQQKSWLA